MFFRTNIGESCRPIELVKYLDRQCRSVLDLNAYAICDKRFVTVMQIQLQVHDPRRRVPFLDMGKASLQQLPNVRDRELTTRNGDREFMSDDVSSLVMLEATPD